MTEIIGNPSLLLLASTVLFLLWFLYDVRNALRKIPDPEPFPNDNITHKNEDDYVLGKHVNHLKSSLDYAHKTKEQIQDEFRSFVKFWAIGWVCYSVLLFSLVIWSSNRSEQMIFEKLDSIEKMVKFQIKLNQEPPAQTVEN